MKKNSSRRTIGNFLIEGNRRFVRPRTSDVANGVTTASEHQQRQIETFHKLDAFAVTCRNEIREEKTSRRRTFERQIETTESITGQRIRTALQNDGVRLIRFHHFADHRFENRFVTIVVDSFAQGKVHCVVFASTRTDVLSISRSMMRRNDDDELTRRSPVPGKYSPNL